MNFVTILLLFTLPECITCNTTTYYIDQSYFYEESEGFQNVWAYCVFFSLINYYCFSEFFFIYNSEGQLLLKWSNVLCK